MIVDDGEAALVVVVVELDGGDFIFSNSKLYAAAEPPLLKQADISWPRKKKGPMLKTKTSVCKYTGTLFMCPSFVYEIEGNEIKYSDLIFKIVKHLNLLYKYKFKGNKKVKNFT